MLSSEDASPGSRQRVLWLSTLAFTLLFNVWLMLGVLGISVRMTATFILPAGLLRPLGGYFSDRWGPRGVTYTVFITMTTVLIALLVPSRSLGLWGFVSLMFILACAMGIGKASVYKYIPDYFPNDVGAVGGVVGMLGALGGFFLPPAFGALGRWSGSPQVAFVALLALTVWSLAWLHLAVVRMRATSANRTKIIPTLNPGTEFET